MSKHNSFHNSGLASTRFPIDMHDKIASVYFIEKYIYILALEVASPGNQHCANCIGKLSFPMPLQVLYYAL